MLSQLDMFLNIISEGDFIVLDTETTGLKNAEICQITIIDSAGKTLLDTLVQPTKPIPKAAWAVHGINDTLVASAPGWEKISHDVADIFDRHTHLVVYNAVFDRHMMYSSDEHIGVDHIEWKNKISWWCAMETYAEMHGEWDNYHNSYRWVKLTDAAAQMNVEISNAHSALGDCQMTLALVQALITD